ncbi:hypothetical protein [Streptomyces virginiae]|uniref:hypothetical protein n=1 Tax=Streptomyces virginiae TaxID=1961 RepID=UPI003423C6E4
MRVPHHRARLVRRPRPAHPLHLRPDTHTETTSQFFFPEDLLTKVYTRPPYTRRTPPRHPNTRDSRYRAAGTTMTLPLTPHANGYRATYTIGIT